MLKNKPVFYGSYKCWLCLCDVCTRIGCPYHPIRHSNRLDHCYKMMRCEFCPVLKCDYFEHKQRRMVLRVKRRHGRGDSILEKLDEIIRKLDNRHGGEPPRK